MAAFLHITVILKIFLCHKQILLFAVEIMDIQLISIIPRYVNVYSAGFGVKHIPCMATIWYRPTAVPAGNASIPAQSVKRLRVSGAYGFSFNQRTVHLIIILGVIL